MILCSLLNSRNSRSLYKCKGLKGVISSTSILFILFKHYFLLFFLGQGPLYSFLRLCVHGSPKDELPVKATDVETVASPTPNGEPASLEYYTKLIICILGLQISYVTWGLLQVRELSCVSLCENYCCVLSVLLWYFFRSGL